ncbi:hypothetical protein E2C01_080155 [Portunus trituberculatus]|uniref:Uncharacterized protein n=1 Tax=Portunus trituberculatus TaxID=210409 RepID=A0A5B7INI6_PORTR|nr:hypothetical protein [Portunus trituberculatus]
MPFTSTTEGITAPFRIFRALCVVESFEIQTQRSPASDECCSATLFISKFYSNQRQNNSHTAPLSPAAYIVVLAWPGMA